MVQIPVEMMTEFVTLNHGNGGRLTHNLIEQVFVKLFGMSLPLTDSAIIARTDSALAYTTDSYVIDPLFFPGGNIGKLAVCGTINDLAVSGARPVALSLSLIIEEGFAFDLLEKILDSIAKTAAQNNAPVAG